MHNQRLSKTPSSINSNSQAAEQNPKLAYRPFGSQIQKASAAPVTQSTKEDVAFAEQKMEAFGLELQAKYGKITPEGQERLTVLQAKMDGLLNSQLQHARRFSHNIANIPLRRPDTPIQAKLTIGEPGDKYEQEADETARQVVQRIHQPQSEKLQRESLPDEEDELQMKPLGSIQRESLPDEEDELQMKPMVQRVSDGGMAATQDLEASINQARGRGQPLAKNIREPMEQGFGVDFSRVKVHTDTQADQLNRAIQAKAFTTGQDVFFRQGAYEPGSRGGQELLAHELTHVVQQSGGEVQRSLLNSPQQSSASASNGGMDLVHRAPHLSLSTTDNADIIQCVESSSDDTQQGKSKKRKSSSDDTQQGKSKKRKSSPKFMVEMIKDAIKMSQRPKFLKSATDKKVKKGQEDRRHVLGWADFIKPNLERGINEILSIQYDGGQDSKNEAKKFLIELAKKYNLTFKEDEDLTNITKTVATWLNSTPNNLNVEDAVENQAIEIIRSQIVSGLKKLETEVEKKDKTGEEVTFKDAKNILLEALSSGDSSTSRVNTANDIKKFMHEIIETIKEGDMVGLIRWANNFKTSTGIDLSKKEGAKDQTEYALKLVNECNNLSGKELITKLFELRKIPDQP